MAGASIEIRDELSPALASVVQTAENPAEIMGDVAAYLLLATQERFERETDPDGQKWMPLAARTAAARIGRGRQRRGTDHILRDRTRLYQSLTTMHDGANATVGTNVVYAAIHQFGGVIRQSAREQKLSLKKIRGKKGMRFVRAGTKGAQERLASIGERSITIPARPYLGINDADRAEIEALITQGFERGLA